MAARVALLILVTGLFAALWSGDHPDQSAQVRRPSKQEIRLDYEREPSSNQSLSRSQSELAAPLPEGITAGTYLVADRFGGTRIRIVLKGEVGSVFASEEKLVNHYSVESRRGRWHYVRIEPSSGEQAAIPESRRSR
ncbi:MAG: hypothetical protein WCH39_10090 [Schlesneria sp.]